MTRATNRVSVALLLLLASLAGSSAGCSEAEAKVIKSPSSAAPAGTANTVLGRAQRFLGPTITKCMGTEFETDQWYRTMLLGGSGGAITPSVADTGGVLVLTSGATASRIALIMPHGTIDLLSSAKTNRWYMVARFITTTAVDAQTRSFMALFTEAAGNPAIVFGVDGATSAAFFSYRIADVAGTTLASGATAVAVNTAYHVYETWNDTTTVRFGIDGTTLPVTTPASNLGTVPVTPVLLVANGSTAAARTMKVDYFYLCTAEPPS